MRQPQLLDAIEATLRFRQPGQARLVVTGRAREQTYRATVTPVEGEGRAGVLAVFEDITRRNRQADPPGFRGECQPRAAHAADRASGFIETLKGAARDDPRRASASWASWSARRSE